MNLSMLIAVYEKNSDRTWEEEDDGVKAIWVTAWNESLRAVYKQLTYLKHEEIENDTV